MKGEGIEVMRVTPFQPEHTARPVRPQREEIGVGGVFAVLRRRWLVILCCVVAGVEGGVAYALFMPPVYDATATLRVDDKVGSMPQVYQRVDDEGEIATEIEVIRSNRLAREVVDSLGLRLQLEAPEHTSRRLFVTDVRVAPDADTATYQFAPQPDGRYSVTTGGGAPVAIVAPGGELDAGGLALRLGRSPPPGSFTLRLASKDDALAAVSDNLAVVRSGTESRIIRLRYRGADAAQVADVLNTLTDRYLRQRQSGRQSEARNTVAFLGTQLDTLNRELRKAEDAFQEFRERDRVVDPRQEGLNDLTRVGELQTQRTSIEVERKALAGLLREVRDSAAAGLYQGPSPYRRLLAFPTLLRNGATTELLHALAVADDERTELLRLPMPPSADLESANGRMREIEEQIRGIATTYLAGLASQERALDSGLSASGRALERVPAREVEFARLERAPKVLEQMAVLLQTRMKEAQIAEAALDPNVQIVDPATEPALPSSPRPLLSAVFGVLLGLLAGGAWALFAEHHDRAVHTRLDVQWATGMPVLGMIPRLPSRRKVQSRRGRGQAAATEHRLLLASGTDQPAISPGRRQVPTGASAEAYTRLQVNLDRLRPGHAIRVLIVTSALSRDGKTTSATNLAMVLAQAGRRVILVDADLRRGTVGVVLGGAESPGLSDVLATGLPLADALRRHPGDDSGCLDYLTAGTARVEASRMLASNTLRDLLRQLRETYDLVIIDSPPLNVVSDAAVLGDLADGVLLVARAGSTPPEALAYAVEQLRQVQAPLVGTLLNDVDPRRDGSYDAGYRYFGLDDSVYAAAAAES